MHLLHRSNDTGRVREVTITDQPGAKLSAGTARGSLAKGSWHGEAVTETNYNKSSRNLRIKK